MYFFALVILMNFFYAGTPTFMKLASLELNPFQIAFLRHTLALLAFLPFFLTTHKKWLERKDVVRVMVGAFLAFTFASVLQIIGMNKSHAVDGSFILAMEPVITIALAFFFLHERFDTKIIAGLSLALAGFVFLSGPSLNPITLFDGRWEGNILFLLAVMGEASFPILFKPLLKRYPPHVVAFYCLLCASFYMLPFQGADLLKTLPTLKITTWSAIGYLGFCGSFLACFLWLTCLRRFSVSMVAVSWFLQPFLGCLFASILLQEAITPNIWVGGSFILVALGLLVTKTEPVPAPVTVLRIQHPLWIPRPLTPIKVRHSKHHLRGLHFPANRYRPPFHTPHTVH